LEAVGRESVVSAAILLAMERFEMRLQGAGRLTDGRTLQGSGSILKALFLE